MVNPQSPYKAHLHIIGDAWGEEDLMQRRLVRLEEAALQSGWIAERFEDGLILLRDETLPPSK